MVWDRVRITAFALVAYLLFVFGIAAVFARRIVKRLRQMVRRSQRQNDRFGNMADTSRALHRGAHGVAADMQRLSSEVLGVDQSSAPLPPSTAAEAMPTVGATPVGARTAAA